MPNRLELKGKKFGNWEVLSFSHVNKGAYWNCICACGNKRKVSSTHLNKKESTKCSSCARAIAPGEANFNRLYNIYKIGANKRNLSFRLSKKLFRKLTKQNCYYCSKIPETVFRLKNNIGNYVYNGVDRLNNNLGYSKENCVPCCKDCNYAKRSYTLKYFAEWAHRLSENLRSKNL